MNLDAQLRVGKNLIFLRNSVKFSQCVFADYLGVSRTTYCQYEKGERLPDMYTLYKICNFYHLKIDTLIDLDLWQAANNFLLFQGNTKDQRRLLDLFHSLSEESKQKLVKRANQLIVSDAERKEAILSTVY